MFFIFVDLRQRRKFLTVNYSRTTVTNYTYVCSSALVIDDPDEGDIKAIVNVSLNYGKEVY